MTDIEVGFIAYKNESGLYDRKVSICRKVENEEAIKIEEDSLNKWAIILREWFVAIMEGV